MVLGELIKWANEVRPVPNGILWIIVGIMVTLVVIQILSLFAKACIFIFCRKWKKKKETMSSLPDLPKL